MLTLQKPMKDSWDSGLEAMKAALALEKDVNQCILELHSLASSHNDPHVSLMTLQVLLLHIILLSFTVDVQYNLDIVMP